MNMQAKSTPPIDLVDHNGGGRGGNNDGGAFSGGPLPVSGAQLGVWIFIGMASILFSAIVSAYIVRMGLGDWVSMPDPIILWINCAILILSSVAMQWASNAAKKSDVATAKKGLLAGGALALLFMLGQLWAWQQLTILGYSVEQNPANTFFYLITMLHALHIIGGLIAWWRVRVGANRGDFGGVRQSVSLCALYWHFLLVVWLVLFGLMVFT